MKLVVKWSDFKNSVANLINEGNSINFPVSKNVNNKDLDEVRNECDIWVSKVLNYLDSSFDVGKNEYWFRFKNARKHRYTIHDGNEKPISQLMTELNEDINEKIRKLEKIVRILSVSDAIIKPAQIDLLNRTNYTVQQTLNLILDKLYELYDSSCYSIIDILKGNGIELKRSHEDIELGNQLESVGFVDLLPQKEMCVRLTLKGKLYVEEKRKEFIENYEDINFDKKQLDERIDEIIERLNNLGLGQEILFDELQELKDTYTKLSKKNWGQLLKGKLFDIGLSKLVENDTLKFIYEQLTNHELRIL